jgi:hypothetical protein
MFKPKDHICFFLLKREAEALGYQWCIMLPVCIKRDKKPGLFAPFPIG